MNRREMVEWVLAREASATGPIVTIVMVSMLRFLGEVLLGQRAVQDVVQGQFNETALQDVTHNALFYGLVFWATAALMSRITGRGFRHVTVPVCVGLLVGILPPILDTILAGRGGFRYTYFFKPAWLFVSPAQPLGETLAVWLGILAAAGFVLWQTRSPLRALLMLVAEYFVLQLAGVAIPASLKLLVPRMSIWHQNLAFWCVILGIFLVVRRTYMWTTVKRINHALPVALITLCGACWAGEPWSVAVAKGFVMLAAFFIATAHNDFHDRYQDATSGRQAGVTDYDHAWLWFLYVVGGSAVFLYNRAAGLLVALFIVVTVLYHSRTTRLKRIFCVSYTIEGLAGMFAFLLGAIPAGHNDLSSMLLLPALLAFGGQALVSGLKDYKDMESDRADGVYTHYTLATMKGLDPMVVHRWLVGACTAGLLCVPVIIGFQQGMSPVLLLLAALAIPPMAWVLRVKEPRRAVEGMFWLLCPYLGVLAWTLRMVTPVTMNLAPGTGPSEVFVIGG